MLDSGCSRSVCGLTWYNCYLDTLPDKVRNSIKVRDSKATFRFGDGEEVKSLCRVNIPCCLAGKTVEICSDVVASELPLLMSKPAMKRASTVLDFISDCFNVG